MKAVVLESPGRFEIREVNDLTCPPGGLLIKVHSTAICSADVKMIYHGHKALVYPRIPGHEVTGTIFESRVQSFNGSERVQVAPGIVCGECHFCVRGASNHCKEIGIIGFTLDGGFAEYIIVPSRGVKSGCVNKIPAHLSFQEAALTEPLACCINGQRAIGISPGDSVLVIGAGPIGCLHSMLARFNGAEKVFLADTLADRLKMVVQAKADRLIDLNTEALEHVVAEETGEFGVDVIILACGEAANKYRLADLLAPQGKICFFSGLPKENSNLDFDCNLVHYKEHTVTGAYGCTAEQNKTALELIASGKIKVDWLITQQISLNEIHTGIEHVKNRVGMKTIINFVEELR